MGSWAEVCHCTDGSFIMKSQEGQINPKLIDWSSRNTELFLFLFQLSQILSISKLLCVKSFICDEFSLIQMCFTKTEKQMLPEETTNDVNHPQNPHDTIQHCCTGCANPSLAQIPLHSQVPLSCTAEGEKLEILKAEKHTGKRVKVYPISTCMWCRFGNQWGEQSPHHSSPLQLGTGSAAGSRGSCQPGDAPAGSEMWGAIEQRGHHQNSQNY